MNKLIKSKNERSSDGYVGDGGSSDVPNWWSESMEKTPSHWLMRSELFLRQCKEKASRF